MADHWFRLPDLIVHPTPLDAELTAPPWHVIASRVADARAKYGVDGSSVLAAVADTGFDREHIEIGNLAGKLYDFTPDGEFDHHGHGTHVAGDLLSMAPRVTLASYKCLNDRGAGDDRWIARAIRAAADDGCWVLNGSFGSPMPGQASLEALTYAESKGCLCVIAGGNTGRTSDVQWPARSSHCVSVSPIDRAERVAPFGSTGPEIDVGYYGVEILSFGLHGGHAVLSGSSMAAPIFAGLLCLRLQWEVKTFGERRTKTIAAAKEWLATCCKDAGSAGIDPQFGHGIPQAMEAFQGGPPPVTPPVVPAPTDPPVEIPLPGGRAIHIPAQPGDDVGLKL